MGKADRRSPHNPEFFGPVAKLLQIGAAQAGTDYAGESAQLYDLVEQDTSDVAWYLEHARRLGGGPVLELGCGTGRVLVPLAREGIAVTGVDLSPDMLAQCRAKLAAAGPAAVARARLVEGDMRDLDLQGEQYRLVILPLYTFVHARTLADKRKTFAVIARHLAPGGELLMEVELEGGLREAAQPVLNVVRRDRDTGRLLLILYQARREPDGEVLLNLLNITIEASGQARLTAVASRESRTSLAELGELIAGSGLELVGFYGDYDWSPVGDQPRGAVVRARRPGPGPAS